MEFANLHYIDWAVVVGYMLFIVTVGSLFTKKASQNLTGFFLSNRSLPWWLAGTSVMAGHISVSQPVKIVTQVRQYGIDECWLQWYTIPATMFGAVFLARLWRRAKIITPVELLRVRYSGAPVHFLTWFQSFYNGVFMQCFFIGMSFIALEIMFEIMFEGQIESTLVILIVCAIALTYTILSGLYAVVITDFIQFIFTLLSMIILVVFIYLKVGGPQELIEAVQAIPGKENNAALVPLFGIEAGSSLAEKLRMVNFLVFVCALWMFNQNLMAGGSDTQRIMGSKDERNSMLMILWSNVVERGLVAWLYIIIGLGSLVLLGGETFDDQAAYPAMGIRFLPLGIKGLFVAGIFAALMSTVDTNLNIAASYVVNDIYKNYFKRHASDRHYVLISRLALAALLGISFIMWYFGMRGTTILNNFKIITQLMVGITLVGVAHWFWWRINAWAYVAAMAGSMLLAACFKWILPATVPFFATYNFSTDYYAIGMIIIALLTTVIWVIVALLTPPTDMERLKDFYRRVRPMGFWGPVRRELEGVEGERFAWSELRSWLSAVACVYFFIFGLGKLLLGMYLYGTVLAIASFVCLRIMLWQIRSSPWWNRNIDAEQDAESTKSSVSNA